MSTGLQESEKLTGKKETKSTVSKAAIFDHIKESCVSDPFYITRVLVSAVGKHAGMIVVRMAIYILVLFPFLTEIVGLSRGSASVGVLLLIIAYYSMRSIYDRLRSEVNNGAG